MPRHASPLLLASVALAVATACAQSPRLPADLALATATVPDLRTAYASGEASVAGVVAAYLQRVESLDDTYAAIIAVSPHALRDARRLDSLAAAGDPIAEAPLFGVPVWLKDNVEADLDLPTTAGARVLANADSRRDAYLVGRLRAAGAVLLGKTNLSEWANFHSTFSSSGYSGVGGQTGNAYDPTRSPCGSSSGSAVAVALGYAPLAIGTETNGSIVCPAQANGVVGLKPTVGLVSRTGVVPIAESQDTPGPFTRSVADAARALNALQGVDPADAYTAAAAPYTTRDYTAALADASALAGKRLGLWTGPLGRHFRVDSLVRQTVRRLEAAGATVVEVESLGAGDVDGEAFEVLLYEFKDGLDRYLASLPADARPDGADSLAAIVAAVDASAADMRYFDHELLRMAAAKGALTDSTYRAARKAASDFYGRDGIDRLADSLQLDAFVAPTGGPAWKIDLVNGDKFVTGSSSPAAVAGYPNLTVPMGLIEGLPVGISFFGKAWSEPTLIELGSAWEAVRGPFAGPGVE